MKVLSFVISLIIVPLVTSFGQESIPEISLDKTIRTTLENNFAIRLAKNTVEIGINNNTYGNAGFLPSVDLSANFNKSTQDTEQEFANGNNQSRDGAKRESYGGSADLSWTLFDGTRMFVVKERLENEALLNQQELKIEVDNVLSRVMILFYQLAFEQERLDLFESNIEFSRERVRIVEEKYNLGKESKLALLQAKVDYNSDLSAMLQQRELLASQRLALIREMGVDPYEFAVQFEIQIDTTLILDQLLAEASDQNLLLQAQIIDKKILENQVEEISRSRLPQLDFNLGYGYSNLESEAGFLLRNQTYDFRYGLTARVNVFNGFNTRRQLENAQIQLKNNSILTSQLKNMVETNLVSVYVTYRNNLELLKLESENLSVALENSQIALERFRLGSSDALELREAQNNAINAQIRNLQAQLNAKQAEIQLYQLSGRLSTITQ